MIRVEYSGGNGRHRLTLKGHAEYGPRGGDIVCAGVSALVYAMLGSIEPMGGEIIRYRMDGGDADILCRGGDGAVLTALTGLEQIAEKYPRNVEVIRTAQGGDSRERP